jgi:hypothetical protein
MLDTFPCPKCGTVLERSGEVEVGGDVLPVFQCDDCTVPWEVGGQVEEAAYTFCVGRDGKPFDPAQSL